MADFNPLPSESSSDTEAMSASGLAPEATEASSNTARSRAMSPLQHFSRAERLDSLRRLEALARTRHHPQAPYLSRRLDEVETNVRNAEIVAALADSDLRSAYALAQRLEIELL